MSLPVVGFTPIPGTLQAPIKAISTTSAVAQTFTVDPGLPVVGRDYNPPHANIVIPKFRFVGVKMTSRSTTGNPVLTLAKCGLGASNVNIIGVAQDNVGRVSNIKMSEMNPTVLRNVYIQYPYIVAVNDANGALVRGDIVTADSYGRPVKYIKKEAKMEGLSAATNTTPDPDTSYVELAGAALSGVTPTNVSAFNITDGAAVSMANASLTWDSNLSNWRVDWPAAALTATDVVIVLYNYGHCTGEVGGQLIQLDVSFPTTDWIQWVNTNFGTFPLSPIALPAPSTSVSADGTSNGAGTYTPAGSLTSNFNNTVYYTTSKPIDPLHAVTVTVDGTAETKSSVAGFINGELEGTNYVIDPLAGTITFPSGYCSATSVVRASYYYVTAYELGTSVWPTGILGISDEGTAPTGLGPGYPPEYIASISGGTTTVGGLKIEVF